MNPDITFPKIQRSKFSLRRILLDLKRGLEGNSVIFVAFLTLGATLLGATLPLYLPIDL